MYIRVLAVLGGLNATRKEISSSAIITITIYYASQSDLLFFVMNKRQQVRLFRLCRFRRRPRPGVDRSHDRTDGGPGRRRSRNGRYRLWRHGDRGPGPSRLPRRLDRRLGRRCRRQDDVSMRTVMRFIRDLVDWSCKRHGCQTDLHSLKRRLRPWPKHPLIISIINN